ncbi:uncharacterized protein Bfra_006356 [Botrytis fragariae]|uniref:Myb-like DNA-binding domain-containing protein n=1 Tax=Botrytis fragariae TaxID=1964551 RepID=A0A8H6ENX5_9HELO|nr:uncharacterized protein Bfra_006356 [Botrytis fragariae]KAF5879152.1 hypothetical protein Bfra_006356 [Botrytis fragariae]
MVFGAKKKPILARILVTITYQLAPAARKLFTSSSTPKLQRNQLSAEVTPSTLTFGLNQLEPAAIMSTDAETQNNNLVLTALFKQIDIGAHGAIDFKRLADDMGVNGQNAARHRFIRFRRCFTRTDGVAPTLADVNNNNLVMRALFKQLKIGRIDFIRLAEDMGVNGQNAARHRWIRLLRSLGISRPNRAVGDEGRDDGGDDEKEHRDNSGNKDRKEERKESDEAANGPVKVEANTKVTRANLPGSPLKFEITREGSSLESPKKGGKRNIEDADGELADEKEGARLMQMPARKFLKSATKSIKKRQRSIQRSDDTAEGYYGHGQDEGFESGFEDIDYTRVPDKKKKRGRIVDEYSGEEDWEA